MSENTPHQPNKSLITLLAISLWLLTVILGVWDILLVRQTVLRTFARFGAADDTFRLINILLMIPLTILVMAITIGGLEYHRTRIGQPSSWRLLSRTLAIELSILALPLFI